MTGSAVRGPRLLIVDDHAGFRARARAVLEEAGFVVVGEAANGRDAVLAAHELRPDVVLLDIVLPDEDGFAVCNRLAEQDECPIVVLTSSRAANSYRRRIRESHAHAFIAKQDLTGAALTRVLESA